MSRTTSADLYRQLERLNDVMGQKREAYKVGRYGQPLYAPGGAANSGTFVLDHNPTYGGWALARIVSPGGGETNYTNRMDADAMRDVMGAMIRVTVERMGDRQRTALYRRGLEADKRAAFRATPEAARMRGIISERRSKALQAQREAAERADAAARAQSSGLCQVCEEYGCHDAAHKARGEVQP